MTSVKEIKNYEFKYNDFILFGQSSDPSLSARGCIYAIIMKVEDGQEMQFTIELESTSNDDNRNELDTMRKAFETCNMANPTEDDESEDDDD